MTSGNTLPIATDVVIVGAGFSGIAMAVRLLAEGRRDFVVLEKATRIGGTWRDNTYPGCACDVPSHLYSFSFAPNPEWSSTYSPQPEIWDYLEKVAREQGVMPHVRLGCELVEAAWEDGRRRWRVRTSGGELSARVLVVAAGPLSEPSIPDVKGLDRFQGTMFHSARWDHDHDLRGERVAVVGTGASAIQFVPEIQPLVAHLAVFQRTPAWILPHGIRPLTGFEHGLYRRVPPAQRAVRAAIAATRELLAIPLLQAGLQPLTRRLGRRLLGRQVADAELRRRLTPSYAPGCKRLLLSRSFYPAIQEPNAELVTSPIQELLADAILTEDGVQHPVDTIIFGTGFFVTDVPIADHLYDGAGVSLGERWAGSPQAHRGTAVAGYPNLYIMLGPNTGLGHTSVVLMAEAQAGYIIDALRTMDREGAAALDVRPEAQARWNEKVQRNMRGTVWTAGGCASWYLDRSGRNSTLWPGFAFAFRRALRRFDAQSYVELPPVAA